MTKGDLIIAAAKGEGCLGKSREDEPVFLLCARDVHAATLVREWADLVERDAARRGLDDGGLTWRLKAKIADARAIAKRMDEWQGRKLPA